MKQHNTRNLSIGVGSAIALSLSALAGTDADPFSLQTITPAKNADMQIAQGMCGGMMEGMCGGNMPHGISPAMLPEPESTGAQALTEYCTQCHALPAPGMHVADEWPSIVGRMNMRMQMMDGMMGLQAPNQDEISTVIDYLQTNAQQPIDKAAYPDLQGPAGQTFSQACAQCHTLPEPKQHTAEEWPSVVARMQGHIAVRDKVMPDKPETKQIIGFLQEHAREDK